MHQNEIKTAAIKTGCVARIKKKTQNRRTIKKTSYNAEKDIKLNKLKPPYRFSPCRRENRYMRCGEAVCNWSSIETQSPEGSKRGTAPGEWNKTLSSNPWLKSTPHDRCGNESTQLSLSGKLNGATLNSSKELSTERVLSISKMLSTSTPCFVWYVP